MATLSGVTPYDRINNLEEFEMIAGDSFELTFTVTDEDDVPVDITSGTPAWYLCPMGQPDYVALTKAGSITDTSTFTVTLILADTQTLSGKYLQQVSFTDFYGKEFRRQGVVTIVPRIE